jgi:hypothetical protein
MKLGLLAVLAAAAAAAIAIPSVYFLAVTISPPVTSDGHHVMPIGQAGIALISGAVLAVIAAVLVVWRGSRRSGRPKPARSSYPTINR